MAFRLGPGKRNLLVSIHVLSVIAWFGGTMTLLLLRIDLNSAENGEQLWYTLSNMHVIDDSLIKYPAMATLITGVMLAVWTQWGLVKYYWIAIKLTLTIAVILIGILFVNPWFSLLVKTADLYGLASLQRQDFQMASSSLLTAAIVNNAALAAMTFITSFKPFGKIRKTPKARS